MKVRGERECQSCRTRWSYYETGEVTCPDCGSPQSVSTNDDRRHHTDAPATLDLSRYRTALADDEDVTAFATDLQKDCRAYLRRRGFINAGTLRPLDDEYLTVLELLTAVTDYSRDRRVGADYSAGDTDAADRYIVTLLTTLDGGERPVPEEVPAPFAATRGLAYVTAVDDYRDEVSTYLDDDPDPPGRRVLGRIRDHVKRIEALDGAVEPDEVERLVRACNDLQRYLAGDETALASAEDRLDSLN